MRSAHAERSGPRPARLGTTLMEIAAATALFGIVLTIAVPIIGSVTAIREQTQRRECAQIELANIMEQVAADHRAGESLRMSADRAELSKETAALLPEADLAMDVATAGDLAGNMRVTARLTWTGPAEQPVAPVELTAFFVDRSSPEAAP